MNSKDSKVKPWDRMLEALKGCDQARCVTMAYLRTTGNDLEIWIVGNLVVIFQIYSAHGGFDVFTPHQAPKGTDDVLPWLLAEGDKL